MIQETARVCVQNKQKAVKKKADLKKTLGPKGLSRVMRRTRRLRDAQERAVEARGAEDNLEHDLAELDPPTLRQLRRHRRRPRSTRRRMSVPLQ